jgi:L-lactate dehydrogenase complex protein LldG
MIDLFRSNAEVVSAVVKSVADVDAALAYVVDICNQKEACTILPSGCEAELSEGAQALCDRKPDKLIAAPDLSDNHLKILQAHCEKTGIRIVTHGLRRHLGGVDIGLTWAQFGIADTGTLVIDSTDEDLRLATMISEIHAAILPVTAIRQSALDIEKSLQTNMQNLGNFTAMITGASRTADIERVLALGVHGPLELHILLVEENHA